MSIFDRLFRRGEYRKKVESPVKEKRQNKEKLTKWQRALTIGFLGLILAGAAILDMVPPTRAQVVDYTRSEVSRIMQANIDANRVEESLEIVPRPVSEATINLEIDRVDEERLFSGTGIVVGQMSNPDQSTTYLVLTNKHVVDEGFQANLVSASLGERINNAKLIAVSPYQQTMDYYNSPDLSLAAFWVPGGVPSLKTLPQEKIEPGIVSLPSGSYLTTYGFPGNNVSFSATGEEYMTKHKMQYAAGLIVGSGDPDERGMIEVAGVHNEGMSGSAIVNEAGRVVGLLTAYSTNDSMLEYLLDPRGFHAHYVGTMITPIPADYERWLNDFIRQLQDKYGMGAKG